MGQIANRNRLCFRPDRTQNLTSIRIAHFGFRRLAVGLDIANHGINHRSDLRERFSGEQFCQLHAVTSPAMRADVRSGSALIVPPESVCTVLTYRARPVFVLQDGFWQAKRKQDALPLALCRICRTLMKVQGAHPLTLRKR